MKLRLLFLLLCSVTALGLPLSAQTSPVLTPPAAPLEGGPSATPSPAPSTTATPAPGPGPVNPYGPTTVVPATLTNVGIPEIEDFYFQSTRGPGYSSLRQTPFLIKLTFDPRWQINVGGPGFMRANVPGGSPLEGGGGGWQGGSLYGFGDPVVSLKYLIKTPDNAQQSTQALQLSYKEPVTNPSLGFSSGRPDVQLTYFYSKDLGKLHIDVNFWLTDVGSPGGDPSRRLQFGDAAGLTIPLTSNLNYELEFHNYTGAAGVLPATFDNMHVFYWAIRPEFNLSFGVDLGLTKTTPKQTYILGTIFHL